MPNNSRGSPVFISGFGGPGPMADLYRPFLQPARYVVSGITKDSTGAILGGCEVDVFEKVSRKFRGTTTSDANGNYSLDVTGNGVVEPSDGEAPTTPMVFRVLFYKAGSPDVAGSTVNTLIGV